MFTATKTTTSPIGCPQCIMLAELVREQNRLLLSFHKAGRDLALLEVEKAKVDVTRVNAEADLMRAEAERRRAEARLKADNNKDNPAPAFGERGHTRTMVTG